MDKYIYYCACCKYGTNRANNIATHFLTNRHKSIYNKETTLNNNKNCIYCKKTYTTNSGYWKHKKTCIPYNNARKEPVTTSPTNRTEYFLYNVCDEAQNIDDFFTEVLDQIKGIELLESTAPKSCRTLIINTINEKLSNIYKRPIHYFMDVSHEEKDKFYVKNENKWIKEPREFNESGILYKKMKDLCKILLYEGTDYNKLIISTTITTIIDNKTFYPKIL